MSDTENFLRARIEALEIENKRLNDELRKVKDCAFKVRLSDPNFNKPLNQIETNYEQITADVHGNS